MDIDSYFIELDQLMEEFSQFLDSCKVEELNTPRGNAWSILEIAEHVLLTETIVMKLLKRVSKATSEKNEIYGKEKLQRLIVNLRAKKVQAPDSLHPKGRINSKYLFLHELRVMHEQLKENLHSNTIVIDNTIHKHPYLGEMTVRDWLYFIPAHGRRHLFQMKEQLNKIREVQ